MKEMVSEDDLIYIRYEIRAKLLLNSINKEDFLKNTFKNYKDTVSISELMEELGKHPLNLNEQDSETFARYVIEPKGEGDIQYSPARTKKVEAAKESLEMALEIAYTFSSATELNEIRKQTLEKVKERIPQTKEEAIDVERWIEIFEELDLDQIEDDILVSIGFENTRDMRKLSLKVVCCHKE